MTKTKTVNISHLTAIHIKISPLSLIF